jgi:hypothetical protein
LLRIISQILLWRLRPSEWELLSILNSFNGKKLIRELYLINLLIISSISLIFVTRPRAASVGDFSFRSFDWSLLSSCESPPSIWLKVTGKPECTSLVTDSRVRNWLWLGKVLAPLTHSTWGKLLRDLMC